MKFEEALVELRKGKEIKEEFYSIKKIDGVYGYSNFQYGVNTLDFLEKIIHSDWKVLEEPGKTFDQVFEDFKNGNKIRRKSWLKTGPLEYNNDDLFISIYHRFIMNNKDILANDWEVV